MFYRPHERVTLDCGEELITKQSHKAECDIHNILKQYQRTGIITHINSHSPQYLDLPSSLDLQDAISLVNQAENAFAALPSSVRERYANDPARFLAAFQDPDQAEFLREVGLLHPKPAPAPSGEAPATSA